MAKTLIIVESPAKAKTIGKILGRNYKVVASVGHVRDLPKSKLGIEIDNNFEPNYITIRGKGPVIKDLKKEAKKVDKILLATDPDREGEAISWHLAHILGLGINDNIRVEFNEVTKDAIKKAIKNPRKLNIDLIDAQQARRVLDRLVGYKISPLLWKKIRKGLSAGRVQSVVVKLICDREEKIEAFIPEEYWTIKSILSKDSENFEANFLGRLANNKEEKIKLKTEEETDKILEILNQNDFKVDKIKKSKRKRNPYAPYTTSTLQQDASKKLGFNTKKTMMIAQQLYEGIDLKKGGTTGLITYMRTDSTRISNEAIGLAKDFIIDKFGKEYSNGGKAYGSKSKSKTQDAHESIRPTNVFNSPDEIKGYLSRDQYKLYRLIWSRLIGSQMKEALYDTLSINIINDEFLFRTTASKLTFKGFLIVYKSADEEVDDLSIPDLVEGDILKLIELNKKQNFTQPPARFTEASIIKALEELGIGRPSTYAPTIATILSRNYVEFDNKSIVPTDLGLLVNEILIGYFSAIINEKFTANLESQLDEVEDGDIQWKEVVGDFYEEFYKLLEIAEEEVAEIEIEDEVSDVICEKCGRNMVVKMGRFGKFLACPGYPECKNTKAILDKLDVECPICDNGTVVRKRSKKGRVFYGCSNYPDCSFVSWDEPIEKKCPKCNKYLVIRRNKKGNMLKCSDKECGYKTMESQ